MLELCKGAIHTATEVREMILPTQADRRLLRKEFVAYREAVAKEFNKLVIQGFKIEPRLCPGANEVKDIELDAAKEAELQRRVQIGEDYRSIGRALKVAVGIAAFKIRKMRLAEGVE